MLLSGPQLVSLTTDGTITSTSELVNGSSIDVRLTDEILVEESANGRVEIDTRTESLDMRRVVIPKEGVLIEPGQFFLACLLEKLQLPDTLSAQFSLRSSSARQGFDQMEAGWIDPGFSGHVTLEIINETRFHALRIYPYQRIGQLMFFRHISAGRYSYRHKGRYNKQSRHPHKSKGI